MMREDAVAQEVAHGCENEESETFELNDLSLKECNHYVVKVTVFPKKPLDAAHEIHSFCLGHTEDRAKERREDHNPDYKLNVDVADFEAFHAVAPPENINLLIGLRFRSEIVKKPDAPQDDDHATPRGTSTLKRKGGDDTPGSSKDGDGDTSFQWSQFTTQCSHLMLPSKDIMTTE
ncbi:suppressor of mec-8 and unc-52 protein homolog 2 [Tanacetum coccineum]